MKSANAIADNIKAEKGVEVSSKTLRNYVNAGKAGVTPLKRGTKGSIPPRAYKALCGAFESYVKLSAVDGDVDITRPTLTKLVNTCINKMPDEKRLRRNLLERIQNDLAGTIDIGLPSLVEKRRETWTTHTNVKTWFDSLSEFFVHYGFAERVENNSTVGEICFLKGQTDRIVNLDESGLSLDNTDSKTGGRPAMGFFDPYLQESASTETHKSSYRLTGMFGCTASGRE